MERGSAPGLGPALDGCLEARKVAPADRAATAPPRPAHLVWLGSSCAALSAALWIRLRPPHLYSEDSINFARSLARFDPLSGRPQFPGYPLFVLQSQLLAALTGSAERAFLAGVILAAALALAFTALLGREMGGGWKAGLASALLLLVNPAFLFAGLTSTNRIYLAAVCAGVAYCCWRMRRGDQRWLVAGSLALGIGSGYRPELIALLFPLWAASAWRGKRDLKQLALALLLLAAGVALWTAVLVRGNPHPLRLLSQMHGYLADQARPTSPLYGAPLRGWLSMLASLAAWNGMAIVGWVVAVPFARRESRDGAAGFLALWVCPILAFHAIVHVGNPGHTLASIPAFCVLGGRVLSHLSRRSRIAAALVLVLALTLNFKTFRRPVSMHPELAASSGTRFFREQFVNGLWAMSWPEFRRVSGQSEATLKDLATLLQAPGEALVVWMDSPVIWQKISYYFPRQAIWVLETPAGRLRADLHLNVDSIGAIESDPRIPVANATRIIWITDRKRRPGIAPAAGLTCVDDNICWADARAMDLLGYDSLGYDLPGYSFSEDISPPENSRK